MSKEEQEIQALELVKLISRMKHDGEITENGSEFYMTQEDAQTTLAEIIESARQIINKRRI